ncbi:FAD-dependent oxidoreductase [Chroococcidiopsis sp. TS-821]|uniref:FAD-dependent oxidoreductase n=1 Tax=Chroococcidiopsis sp. TS-821 TaxID=1378066 RepID=UPI000CEED1D1|nr:FAD-dependent oxidoreductase [Chroococcidiopsis sp. TS-821]PPS43954.1 glucose-inhibited division protein A [Chroococcidiopsis sp. TS-821]
MQILTADVLVVGGGTGGTAAAIASARRGAKTILVSEFPWLGGMLTSAGVSAPDGNELEAFQTGLWGAFLKELQQRHGGLDRSWVSFFSYDPRVGAQIFAEWVQALPNLHWIRGEVPLEVYYQGGCITGVRFREFAVTAKITLDATELGDILALADVPYRWGWELQSEWNEPSAPVKPNALTAQYPVQAPTWVVIMQDYSTDIAPEIAPAPNYDASKFSRAWENYGVEQFLNYGRLPENRFMINWPIHGNDYGVGVERLIASKTAQNEFLQECFWHSQNFAYFIQSQIGCRYGLADVFDTGLAMHPYYRESRRVIGLDTVREQDILPIPTGQVAAFKPDAIAFGNYPNDHHYPGFEFPLTPKSIRWGGRWTGTPFTIPYGCLIPATIDGLLVCEKNISVSHIANGATRLQPVVMGIGQAAGTAAALCVEQGCQPRELAVRTLQEALLAQKAAIAPLFNLPPQHPDWLYWQKYYLDNPEKYPVDGNCPCAVYQDIPSDNTTKFSGTFYKHDTQNYTIRIDSPTEFCGSWILVTLRSHVNHQLETYPNNSPIEVSGRINYAGKWLLVQSIHT